MAVTKTTRLNQTRWSSGQDSVARTDFDSDAASLEANVALFKEGTLAERPPAGVRGRFYTVKGDSTAANNGRQFYDNGTEWRAVSYSNGMLVESNNTETAATLLVKGGTSETYESFRVDDNSGNKMMGVNPNKTISVGTSTFASAQAAPTSTGLSVVAPSASQVGLSVQGAVGQTEHVVRVLNSSGGTQLSVSPGGSIATSGNVSAANVTVTGSGALTAPAVNSTASSSLKNATISGVDANSIPLTLNAAAGQNTNILAMGVDGNVAARIASNGDFLSNRRLHLGNGNGSGTSAPGASPQLIVKNSLSAGQPAARVMAHDAQSGNVLEVTTGNESTKLLTVDVAGKLSTSGPAAVGGALTVNGATLDPLFYTGATPTMEILTGTASGTFADRVVLRHSQTSTAAVARSTGLVMSLGGESSAGTASKSASIYVQSNSAASDNPTLRLAVGNTSVVSIDANRLLTVEGNIASAGTDAATPNLTLSGGLGRKISLYQSPDYDIGVQTNTMYSRGNNFAWYQGGSHSNTQWSAGGGSTLMTLTSGSDKRLTVGRITINDPAAATSATPLLRLGSGAEHMQFSNLSVNVFTDNTNTENGEMWIQAHGTNGKLNLGSGDTEVNIPSRVIRVGANYIYFGGDTWGAWCGYNLRAPIDNDMWFDPTRNGIYFRGSSSWVTLAGPQA